jgi:glycerol-3-phosphate acyltransferase PlsY
LAYLLGSIPTALLVSKRIAGVDIRTVGDGNMGAHNVKSQFGWGPSIVVAVVDFAKGALAVLLARALGLSLDWQIAALTAAVLGHDFPVFAHLRGGQGLATTLGGLTSLAFWEMVAGLVLFELIYLITRNSNLGASIGTGTAVLIMALDGRPRLLVIGVIAVILMIPAKNVLNRRRREQIRMRHA